MTSAGMLRFDDQVAIITGAGGGLGRTYALLFASRGAKVVVNDLGGGKSGEGSDKQAADYVVDEIVRAGGIAVANYNSVEDGEAVVKTALDNFGRIDILVNNAGILRDKSFARTSDLDWDLVQRVHLRGSFMMTRAVWPHMKKQNYGRIIMTSSVAGIYGNFGQANYSAAKLGLVGLSNTLAIEGQKNNILCNAIAPMGATRLTQGILPPDLFEELKPELVAPLVAWLCHADCEDSGSLFEAGAGWFGKYRWARSKGSVCRKNLSEMVSPEAVRDNWNEISSFENSVYLESNEEAAGKLVEALSTLSDVESTTQSDTSLLSGPLSAVGMTQFVEVCWEPNQVILYALGVTVSTKDKHGLQFLYEGHENFSALPTFAIVPLSEIILGQKSVFSTIADWEIDFSKVLHGEQYVEVLSPLPPEGKGFCEATITDVLDKGSGAVALVDASLFDYTGKRLVNTQWSVFIVGAGGFDGPRSSVNTIPLIRPPQRNPEAIVEVETNVDQAALYRLSGDLNPLHIDPSFAAMGGFKEPILHGLCSFGIVTKTIIDIFCDGDVTMFKSIKTRFAKPITPGDTVVISLWQERKRIYFEAKSKRTDNVILSGGYVDLYRDPKKRFDTEDDLMRKVDDDFMVMASSFDRKIADKMNVVYEWNITDHEDNVRQTYTFDFMAPSSIYKGTVRSPKPIKAKIRMKHHDFLKTVMGNGNPNKLLADGKITVDGMVVSWNYLMSPFFPPPKL